MTFFLECSRLGTLVITSTQSLDWDSIGIHWDAMALLEGKSLDLPSYKLVQKKNGADCLFLQVSFFWGIYNYMCIYIYILGYSSDFSAWLFLGTCPVFFICVYIYIYLHTYLPTPYPTIPYHTIRIEYIYIFIYYYVYMLHIYYIISYHISYNMIWYYIISYHMILYYIIILLYYHIIILLLYHIISYYYIIILYYCIILLYFYSFIFLYYHIILHYDYIALWLYYIMIVLLYDYIIISYYIILYYYYIILYHIISYYIIKYIHYDVCIYYYIQSAQLLPSVTMCYPSPSPEALGNTNNLRSWKSGLLYNCLPRLLQAMLILTPNSLEKKSWKQLLQPFRMQRL